MADWYEVEAGMTLDQVIAEFSPAATAFAQGNPDPVKLLFSHADDVTLANPFGPAVRGWDNVSAALNYASSRFSNGEMTDVQTIARYEAPELVTVLGTEHWRTSVGGGAITDFDLRVTTTYRKEQDGWRIVHRHADPIASSDERGPLRQT